MTKCKKRADMTTSQYKRKAKARRHDDWLNDQLNRINRYAFRYGYQKGYIDFDARDPMLMHLRLEGPQGYVFIELAMEKVSVPNTNGISRKTYPSRIPAQQLNSILARPNPHNT